VNDFWQTVQTLLRLLSVEEVARGISERGKQIVAGLICDTECIALASRTKGNYFQAMGGQVNGLAGGAVAGIRFRHVPVHCVMSSGSEVRAT
jgi:hypothetical protein